MQNVYLVQLYHPIMGNSLLGTLEAETIERAQRALLGLLNEHGVPEEHISYDVSEHHTITLRGEVVLKIYRSMRADQWAHIIPLLIAY